MLKYSKLLLISTLLAGAFATLSAEITLPQIFSNHMVLQRNTPIPIWGMAFSEEEIRIEVSGYSVTTQSDVNGKWKAMLPSMKAGGPYIITVSGQNQLIELQGVMIGEVWLCSGQSNMEWPLEQSATAETAVPSANHSEIRLFLMKKKYSLGNEPFSNETMEDINTGKFYKKASWEPCTKETAAKFSAVAYFFGKKLYDSLKVPIGLIQNAVGGSPIQSWVSSNGLKSHPQLEYLTDAANGKTWHYQPGLHPWVAQRAMENLQPWLDKGVNGIIPRHPFGPSYLFDTGIKPLTPFPIKGMIWYQGESDATNPDLYLHMFNQFVQDIRKAWDHNELPVIFVQLPKIGNRSSWPEFRAIQAEGLNIPNTAMVVSIDTGHPTDVHPREKKAIGQRMAGAALGKCYDLEVAYLGPTLESWFRNEDTVRLIFENTGTGLTVAGKSLGNVLLEGYNESGTKGLTVKPSGIEISGDEVIIGIPVGMLLTTIKYAWLPYPDEPLLYNSYDLPAAPFKIKLPGNN